MEWYYAEGGQQAGPVTEEQLNALVLAGRVRGDTLVWRAGMDNWKPHDSVRPSSSGVAAAGGNISSSALGGGTVLATPTMLACSECGKAIALDEAIQFGAAHVCSACKPLFLQKLREGAVVSTRTEYGGFWIRFVAKFLDGIIQGIALSLPLIVLVIALVRSRNINDPAAMVWLQIIYQGLALIVGISYNTFFVGKWGATPGKMICGLKVVLANKSTLGYGRAFGRAWAEYLNMFTLGIGYVIAAFDAEKRSLHDHVCNTRVIKTR